MCLANGYLALHSVLVALLCCRGAWLSSWPTARHCPHPVFWLPDSNHGSKLHACRPCRAVSAMPPFVPRTPPLPPAIFIRHRCRDHWPLPPIKKHRGNYPRNETVQGVQFDSTGTLRECTPPVCAANTSNSAIGGTTATLALALISVTAACACMGTRRFLPRNYPGVLRRNLCHRILHSPRTCGHLCWPTTNRPEEEHLCASPRY
jgi:hypothetical protein